MPAPIADDFAAIHARLLAIRAAERPWAAAPEEPPAPAPASAAAPAGPQDFHSWLMGGGLWSSG